MSEPRYTPGPWRPGRNDTLSYHWDGSGPYKAVYVDDPNGEFHMGQRLPAVVAECYGPLGADPREIAALIAAAPDLLAALEEAHRMLLTAMRADLGFPAGERAAIIDGNPGIIQIRAAIARAKGKG